MPNTDSALTMEGHFEQKLLSSAPLAGTPKRNNVTSISKASIPFWLRKTNEDLFAITALNDNWDSYGAKRISVNIVKVVASLLLDIMFDSTPPPQIVPSATGSIQLEWHMADIDLEVEIRSSDSLDVSFEDIRNEEQDWNGVISFDLGRIVHYVQLLTSRASEQNNINVVH